MYGKNDIFDPTFPQFSIKIARFRGYDRLSEFDDNRWYKDHAFGLLRRAEDFLYDNMPIAGKKISGKMRREDYPLYPPLAFREAVANAICHRDYTYAGGALTVAMYNNRLEVINPGNFHFGMTPKKLTQPHESRPWNPLIANAFYCAGIIESWGSGTLNILEYCKSNGNPSPFWEERSRSIAITFFPRDGSRVMVDSSDLVTDQVTDQVTNQSDIQILSFCKEAKKASQIMEMIGLKHRRTFNVNYLRPLLEKKFLSMTLPDRPQSRLQQYKTTQEGLEFLKGILPY